MLNLFFPSFLLCLNQEQMSNLADELKPSETTLTVLHQ